MDHQRQVGCLLIVMVLMFQVGGIKCSLISEFERCYVGSFILCVIIPTNTAYACSLKSLKDCIPSPPVPPNLVETLNHGEVAEIIKDINYFCKLGCASSLCTNISTKNNPGASKVANCVGSCSETCSNHNHI